MCNINASSVPSDMDGGTVLQTYVSATGIYGTNGKSEMSTKLSINTMGDC